MNNINNIIKEITDKISNIEAKDSKLYALFIVKLIEKLEDCETIIDDYLIDNFKNLDIDSEIKKKIDEVKHTRNMINLFLPYMMCLQLNNV